MITEATTFQDLGIPFPLFEGPVRDASEYAGLHACSICGRRGQHSFLLGIGAALVACCPECGADVFLNASDRKDTACGKCGCLVSFLPGASEEIVACYSCLRDGKAGLTKDTELGMVSWEQALAGMTHGRPGLKRKDFELVPTDSDWVRARVPQETLFELLRTPTYLTIQGECWQFCCRKPMVYLGAWAREEFARRAPDGDGRKLFSEVVQDAMPGLWEDQLHDVTGVYAFRCSACGRITAHWDIA